MSFHALSHDEKSLMTSKDILNAFLEFDQGRKYSYFLLIFEDTVAWGGYLHHQLFMTANELDGWVDLLQGHFFNPTRELRIWRQGDLQMSIIVPSVNGESERTIDEQYILIPSFGSRMKIMDGINHGATTEEAPRKKINMFLDVAHIVHQDEDGQWYVIGSSLVDIRDVQGG